MNTTKTLSLASLIFGLFFLVFAIAVIGAPLLDVGMLSTAAVFLLLGGIGLALDRAQTA